MTAATQLVYRVEHEDDREGPYSSDNMSDSELREMAISHGGWDHPCPVEDGLARADVTGRIFGFSSRDRLRRWFDGWLEMLEEKGYRLVVYRVPETDVAHGRMQLVFTRPDTPPRTYSLVSLLK